MDSRGGNRRRGRAEHGRSTRTETHRGRGRGARSGASVSRNTDANFEDGGELNADLQERFKYRGPRSNKNNHDGRTLPEKGKFKLVHNPEIAAYIRSQDKIVATAQEGDWLAQPEIPSADEINVTGDAVVVLPANRTDRPWGKKESYLKTHYKLLREDAVTGLRESVKKFRQDTHRYDDHDTRIYDKVRVVGLTFTYKGVAARIQFSTRSMKRIVWSANKRLIAGTLVAMSPATDNFKTICLLATVAARPLRNLDTPTPEIDIFFADTNSHEVDAQNEYVMVEAYQGYFEAYRHTLRALQKQSKECFPLSEHICHLDPTIDAPIYLKKQPWSDLSPAASEEDRERYLHVNVLSNFPPMPGSSLDSTQLAAMKDILTKKLAIIQGPPGTGKTHVSKIALEILLRNRVQETPLIIACQTNHALDQLLEKIHPVEPKYIRLGGRCTSTTVKQRALHEVRMNEVVDDVPGSVYSKARRDILTHTMKMKSLLDALDEGCSPAHLPAETLRQLGVLTDGQCKSLEDNASRWVRADGRTEDAIQIWLGSAIGAYIAPQPREHFGFDEIEEDLEMEQQRELDAENGLVDEEDAELLKGDFVSLAPGMVAANMSSTVQAEAIKALDDFQDLFKAPDYLKGAMYMIMQAEAKSIIRNRFREAMKEYMRLVKNIQIGRWEKDIVYLQNAPIVGMTTTGLSKYRPLISALKPKIILIEEAAEVLEGPVSVACMESLQHLILVGDHKQLQANCSVKELEGKPYSLEVSMFERLVNNKMPFRTLLKQRRMMPEFRQLIQPTYPQLEDHPSVLEREIPPWGMGEVFSYFWTHDYADRQDDSMSTCNDHEADMVAKFYRHLIRNGVPKEAVTVLTFYNGQRKVILKKLKEDPDTASIYNKVKTVDSYQGEENQIILLSLVRSNQLRKIGFLGIANRMTVALSRAKFGFYLFGNRDFLAEANDMWTHVAEVMYNRRRSHSHIPVTCTRHNRTLTLANPGDFDKYQGGCDLPCGSMLGCNHPCRLLCHPFSHEDVICNLPCQKELVCGHLCELKCSAQCECLCGVFQREKTSHTVIPNGGTWAEFMQQSRVSPVRAVKGRSQLDTRDIGAATPRQTVRIGSSDRTTWTQEYQPVQPPVRAMANMNLDGAPPEMPFPSPLIDNAQPSLHPRVKNDRNMYGPPPPRLEDEWYDSEMEERMKQIAQQDDYW